MLLNEVFLPQLYRLERYDECKAVYTDLIRNSQDEYEEERKTNLSAVVAAMSQWGESSPVSRRPHNAESTVYNQTNYREGDGGLETERGGRRTRREGEGHSGIERGYRSRWRVERQTGRGLERLRGRGNKTGVES